MVSGFGLRVQGSQDFGFRGSGVRPLAEEEDVLGFIWFMVYGVGVYMVCVGFIWFVLGFVWFVLYG